MYVTTIARSLGDPQILPPVQSRPSKNCGRRWKAYIASSPNQPHRWADFLRVNPDCHGRKHVSGGPIPPVLLSGLGTTAACADAGTGLLIDCWRQAEHKGLGYSLDQAELAKVATAYQRMTRPNSLAGWVFDGRKMVWRGGALGDDVLTPPPSYVTPPNPLTIAQSQPSPLPSVTAITPSEMQAMIPAVTAQTLLAAAQLPNAPTIVQQAAAQLPPQQAGFDITSWFTGQTISGIPNYALVGAAVVVLMLLSRGRRR